MGYIKSYVETSDKTLRQQWPCALTSLGVSNTDTDLPRVKRTLTRNRGNENHSINSLEPRRYTLSQSESIREVSFASGLRRRRTKKKNCINYGSSELVGRKKMNGGESQIRFAQESCKAADGTKWRLHPPGFIKAP